MPSFDNVICTLYEGDYHAGVAVLINSFVQKEFEGAFWVGYRGLLPPWIKGLRALERENSFQVTERITLFFEELETTQHLTNFKPEFMRSLVRRGISTNRLCYFDPDIINECVWPFYETWLDFGVALCEEAVNGTMPANHPLRLLWIKLGTESGFPPLRRKLDRYYNGGFVGVTSRTAHFLDLWEKVMEAAAAAGLDRAAFMAGGRQQPFYASDQDALNMAAMYFDGELSTIGPEGMGFLSGGFTMHHASGGIKPWRKSFLLQALRGEPPTMADKRFLICASGPLHPFTARSLQWRRFQAKLATAIRRVYSRV